MAKNIYNFYKAYILLIICILYNNLLINNCKSCKSCKSVLCNMLKIKTLTKKSTFTRFMGQLLQFLQDFYKLYNIVYQLNNLLKRSFCKCKSYFASFYILAFSGLLREKWKIIFEL